jgi:hypothetical protein
VGHAQLAGYHRRPDTVVSYMGLVVLVMASDSRTQPMTLAVRGWPALGGAPKAAPVARYEAFLRGPMVAASKNANRAEPRLTPRIRAAFSSMGPG